MRPELQRAMARFEEARFHYRKAVLASLNREGEGAAIRQAIRSFQDARAELKRVEAWLRPPPLPRKARDEAQATSRPQVRGLFLKLLRAS